MGLLQKLFGTHSENELKRIYPIVDRIEALEPEMQSFGTKPVNTKNVMQKESLWMTCFQRRTRR